MCKTIQKSVGCAVINLPGGSVNRRPRGKEDEQLQMLRESQDVQIPRAVKFWLQYGVNNVPGLTLDGSILEHARSMPNPSKIVPCQLNRFTCDSRISDIALNSFDRYAFRFKTCDQLKCRLVRFMSSYQDEIAGTVLNQPLGQTQTD